VLKRIAHHMRLHQWIKNLLMFIPFLVSGRWSEPGIFRASCNGFAAFCFTATATYIFSDIIALGSDPRHPFKTQRPLNEGKLSIGLVSAIGAAFCVFGLSLALWLSRELFAILIAYGCLSILYCFFLRKNPLFDDVLISTFYTMRIMAGGFSSGIRIPLLIDIVIFVFFMIFAWKKRLSNDSQHQHKPLLVYLRTP
jgi:4-hydroxybenzoate polyprenyltransferase